MIYTLKGEVLSGWTRKVTPDDFVPYYIHTATNSLTWDHPEFLGIMKLTENFSAVKFRAYRTAFKVRSIQKSLNWNAVSMSYLLEAFDKRGDVPMMNCQEVYQFLLDIYLDGYENEKFSDDPTTLAQLMLNFLIVVLLSPRRGVFHTIQVQAMLILMLSAKLTDKYKCIHHYMSDENSAVKEELLKQFFETIVMMSAIFEEVNPDAAYQYVSFSMENFSKKVENNEKSEKQFTNWLLDEPENVLWVPALYRIISSEGCSHDVKCKVCRSRPITGLRYRCLYCTKYNLCQNCFLQGLSSKTHNVEHPTLEYCKLATVWNDVKSSIKIMGNKIFATKKSKDFLKFDSLMRFSGRPNDYQDKQLDENEFLHETILGELQAVILSLEFASKKLSWEVTRITECQGLLPYGSKGQDIIKDFSNIIQSRVYSQYLLLDRQIRRLKLLAQYFDLNDRGLQGMKKQGPNAPKKYPSDSCIYSSSNSAGTKCPKSERNSVVLAVNEDFETSLAYFLNDLTAGYSTLSEDGSELTVRDSSANANSTVQEVDVQLRAIVSQIDNLFPLVESINKESESDDDDDKRKVLAALRVFRETLV